MSARDLIIEGAKQNNLKNISLRLPHNKVIAVTGLSGSGKSSLAFDTIFAEGQWRFIESLSTYARLFLEKLDRPDVDTIRNIRPAVALEQRNPVRGSRSTVGTLTEIHDYLRVLFSKVATPHCPGCGREIRKWDTSQIIRLLIDEYRDRRAIILFESLDSPEELRKRGFLRYLRDGAVAGIETAGESAKGTVIPVVLDRLEIRDEPRLSDSIETAWREGKERLRVMIAGDGEDSFETFSFSSAFVCDSCGTELQEPTPLLFSFNHPVGACPECKGFGNILKYDEALIIPDKSLSLSGGAVEPWDKPAYRWWKKQFIEGFRKAGADAKKPVSEFSKGERKLLFEGGPSFYGINDFFAELESKRYKLHVRVFLSRYRNGIVCPACSGKRLRREALAFKVSGSDITELSGMPVADLPDFFRDCDLSPFQRDIAKEALRQIHLKLSFLNRVGLGYLALSRQGKTLSGGEYQRINLSNQLASHLTGTLYVLDEPTVGLHARDTEQVAKIMSELSGRGNTIIVVEHDKDIISTADWIVELGPGAGSRGGEIVFSGTGEAFLKAATLTASSLKRPDRLPTPGRAAARPRKGKILSLHGAKGNNLDTIDIEIPLRSLTAVSGVSGSGKSTLIADTLYPALARHFGATEVPPLPYHSLNGTEHLNAVKIIDQSPIGRSPRSNPATYLKIFDHIRKIFAEQPEARAHGYGPGFFSFNIPGGRCEACRGEGFQKMEMYFFEDMFITCEECSGKKYRQEALRVSYQGRSIAEVLDMTVDDASRLFGEDPRIVSRLSTMQDVGLGYLRLGQSATTLSGGEAQRLKICSELTSSERGDVLYILDEPTVGLHAQDVALLIDVLRKLIDSGNTVVVIEHNLDIVKTADWVIDLGPEGGSGGGKVLFSGSPEDLMESAGSYTGRYLRKYLGPEI